MLVQNPNDPKHLGSLLRRQMSVGVTLTQWEVDAAEFNTQKSNLMSKEIGIEKRKKLFISHDNHPAHSVAQECVL